jgi:hypothetical protein
MRSLRPKSLKSPRRSKTRLLKTKSSTKRLRPTRRGTEASVEPEELAAEETSKAEEPEEEPVATAVAKAAPGFSKLLDSLAGLTGFYGSQPVQVEPVIEPDPASEEPAKEKAAEKPVQEEQVEDEEPADEQPVVEEASAQSPVEEPETFEEPVAEKPTPKQPEKSTSPSEGTLQDKLADVRSKADEARMAKLRANMALYEGLSAAYDFALDAEEAPRNISVSLRRRA